MHKGPLLYQTDKGYVTPVMSPTRNTVGVAGFSGLSGS